MGSSTSGREARVVDGRITWRATIVGDRYVEHACARAFIDASEPSNGTSSRRRLASTRPRRGSSAHPLDVTAAGRFGEGSSRGLLGFGTSVPDSITVARAERTPDLPGERAPDLHVPPRAAAPDVTVTENASSAVGRRRSTRRSVPDDSRPGLPAHRGGHPHVPFALVRFELIGGVGHVRAIGWGFQRQRYEDDRAKGSTPRPSKSGWRRIARWRPRLASVRSKPATGRTTWAETVPIARRPSLPERRNTRCLLQQVPLAVADRRFRAGTQSQVRRCRCRVGTSGPFVAVGTRHGR